MKHFELDIISARYQEAKARISKLRREKTLNEVEEENLAKLLQKQLEMDKHVEKLARDAKNDLEAFLGNAMKILEDDPELPYIYLAFEYDIEECEEDEEESIEYKRYYLTPRGVLVVITYQCPECNPGIYEISIETFLERIVRPGAQEIHEIADNILNYYEKKASFERLEKAERELVYIR